ncbi:MAG: hypothetical protein U0U25_02365 [Flavobacteriales bacterium]
MEPFIRGLFAQVPDDEEGARYRVLAYVQRVKQGFGQRKLYPYLPELRSAQRDLEDLFRRREELGALMPGDLIGWDGSTGRALRTRTEDPLWQVLDQVYAVAQPLLERTAEEGTGLRQDLLGHIRVEPVGVLPLRTDEGYLLLRHRDEARVYTYRVGLHVPEGSEPPERAMRTAYVAHYTLGITWQYDHVKADLVRQRPELPNPAMFAFSADVPLPAIETFVPLAKSIALDLVRRNVH